MSFFQIRLWSSSLAVPLAKGSLADLLPLVSRTEHTTFVLQCILLQRRIFLPCTNFYFTIAAFNIWSGLSLESGGSLIPELATCKTLLACSACAAHEVFSPASYSRDAPREFKGLSTPLLHYFPAKLKNGVGSFAGPLELTSIKMGFFGDRKVNSNEVY